MQKLSWKSIQEQFPKYVAMYKNEFKALFSKSGKTELSIEDIDNYLNRETSLTAYKIGGYTRYFNDTAGRTLGRVEVADNGDSQCYDTGGSLLGMVIGGQTFAANGVLLSPQDILASLLVNENRVQAKKASQECIGCSRYFNTKLVNNYDKAIYLCPNCIDKEKEIVEKLIQPINQKSDQKLSFKNLVNWFKQASYYSEERSAKIIGDYIIELAEVYFEEESGRAYSHAEVKITHKEGKGEFKFKTPIKTKRFDTLQEAEEMYNKINTEEDFNLLAGKQADIPTQATLFDINTADEVINRLQSELQIPFVQPYKSTLGGADRVTIMIKASLDAKDTWAGGYFENSRRLNFSVERDGTIEQFSKSFKIPTKFRKTKVKSIDELIAKLNNYFASVQNIVGKKQANESQELFEIYEDAKHGDISAQKFLEELFDMPYDAIMANDITKSDKWQEGITLLKEMRNEPVEKQADGKTFSGWDGIPFEMDDRLFAAIAGMDLPKNEIKDEAKTAFENHEIDEIDYNRIIWYLENVYDKKYEASNKQADANWQLIATYELNSGVTQYLYWNNLTKSIKSDTPSLSFTRSYSLKEAPDYLTASQLVDVYSYLRDEDIEFTTTISSTKQADELLIDPRMHVPESYSPLYEERTVRPEEWTSYSMQDIEYVDPLWDDSGEEIKEKQPSKYIPKKKQRGKYNLHEIVMTPEGQGRIVMKQVDYRPYSYTVALTGKDEITIVEEPQIQRLASIGKQAVDIKDFRKKIEVLFDVWVGVKEPKYYEEGDAWDITGKEEFIDGIVSLFEESSKQASINKQASYLIEYFKNPLVVDKAKKYGLIDIENEDLTALGLIAKMHEWDEMEHGVPSYIYDMTKKNLESQGEKMPEDIRRIEGRRKFYTMASITKQSKRNDALYYATVNLEVWVDGDDLEYDYELEKIKNSNASEDEKIEQAKERVTEIVRDAVYKVQIPDTESEVYINDVQIDKLDRDSKYDNIDYAALFPAVYAIPKEIDFRGYTGEPKQFTEDSTEYQIINKLTDEEYESYDRQLRESGVDLSFKGEGMILKKKGSKKSANAKELWEMTKEEFKQYLDIHLVPENWKEVMGDIISKIPYNTSIYNRPY